MTRDVWADRFDKRYGAGEFVWLYARLGDARYTFSKIAARYGVTRERVRQWHRLLMPDAPTGHARRREYRLRQDWRELLHDGLFGAFHAHARHHAPQALIRPVPTAHGYSRARAWIDGWEIALRQVKPRARKSRAARRLRVTRPAAPLSFVYILLPEGTFFLLPAGLLPERGGVFEDTAQEYQRFKDTFEAIALGGAAEPAPDPQPAPRRAKGGRHTVAHAR